MLTDIQRLEIACVLVRQERQAQVIEDERTQVAIHGITLNKLLDAQKAVSAIYCSRKNDGKDPNFEEILEDSIVAKFSSEDARTIAKHVLGHIFSWRRNHCLSPEANIVAKERGMLLL